ncbi:hypothetical protein E1283_10515 [Streptomyces hainanensis]|uniref:Uncharacterized protein n=1 Tax=Streptomyces hainanensis TaxID=402648 RepID=A0A4R4TER5_9ACTN|nr:hypothetical protein E1283_10515 [Streptomyces hainanensis]
MRLLPGAEPFTHDGVPVLTADTVHISADWSALVLRHGTAFIGHRPDHGPTDSFYGYAELHTRSVYFDALLFGVIQRDHIDQLTEDLTDVFTGPREATRLATLKRRIAHFRSTYWRQHLTTHGTANDLLTAYKNQYRLPERFTDILAEAADHNRLIQTRENQQISGALGIITILGLPLTIIQVLGDQTPRHLITAPPPPLSPPPPSSSSTPSAGATQAAETVRTNRPTTSDRALPIQATQARRLDDGYDESGRRVSVLTTGLSVSGHIVGSPFQPSRL